MVLVVNTIAWQCFFLGTIGVVFCASSLSSGIIIAVTIPVTEVLAVMIYKEKFQVEKGVSLALSLWGLVSYFYGEIKHPNNRGVDRGQPPPPLESESEGPPSQIDCDVVDRA